MVRKRNLTLNNEIEDLSVIALPGYNPEIGRWLWALEDTRHDTLKSLDGLTDEDLDNLPPGADNKIGALLYHIAIVEVGWLHGEVLEQKSLPPELEALFPADSRDEQKQLTYLQGASLQDHLQRLEKVRASLMAEFRGMSIEEFRRPRHFPGEYNVTPEWVLHHLIQHEAEHRGHIQTLRHLLGK
jgi:uncharacterized damage-inducible protein DinB